MTKNIVRELRQNRGMNQRQLAEAAHTGQSLISAIETGKMQPWPAVKKRISTALGVLEAEIFPEAENA